MGLFTRSAQSATPADGALRPTRDTSNRRVQGEPPATSVDTSGVNAERGRGYLSGDGRMHQHRS